ncbi:MAG: TetR/AcrR family transcriptional regulator [Solobacterium sp.]|nr:TetR/AcrR family transcriptional regulator [Solobacterium sp.]
MGKAFTEQEREEVHETLRRTGLRLFSRKGIRGVSIRELSSAAGIAQGGFYSFYKDKDEFIVDLVELRVREKLEGLLHHRESSLNDPVHYLSDLFFQEGMHLKENKAFDNMISGTLSFFHEEKKETHERISHLYREFLENLKEYWIEHGYEVSMDVDGLMNLIRAVSIFFSNATLMDDAYFERMFRRFCDVEVQEFLSVERRKN